MGLENLKQEVIEEGRSHVFVETLVKALRDRHGMLTAELVGHSCSSGVTLGLLCSLGGRVAGIGEAVRMITNAQGVAE